MFLHVVRHAQSMANVNRSSIVDCDLTDEGRLQAQRVAAELRSIGIDHVLSSPYRRTLCTAEVIASATGVPLEVLPGLHEHHVSAFPPDWPLMTRSELSVNFPGLILPDDLADQCWHTPPETDQVVLDRMARILNAIDARFGNTAQRLVLVTHGSPASKLVQAFLGALQAGRTEVAIDNASITTLELSAGRRMVRCVNRIDHLRASSDQVLAHQPVLL